jgi:RNA polymerase I-specific transcription initiation factor RRN6
VSSSNKGSGPDPEDFEQFKFFQVWALTSDLGLSSTLCAVNDSRTSSASISAPTTKVSQSLRRIGSRNVKDLFIVPDEDNEEDGFLGQFWSSMRVDAAATSGNDTDDLRLRMNWRGLFEHVFLQKYPNSEPDAYVLYSHTVFTIT